MTLMKFGFPISDCEMICGGGRLACDVDFFRLSLRERIEVREILYV
jgi:hypothetical protein